MYHRRVCFYIPPNLIHLSIYGIYIRRLERSTSKFDLHFRNRCPIHQSWILLLFLLFPFSRTNGEFLWTAQCYHDRCFTPFSIQDIIQDTDHAESNSVGCFQCHISAARRFSLFTRNENNSTSRCWQFAYQFVVIVQINARNSRKFLSFALQWRMGLTSRQSWKSWEQLRIFKLVFSVIYSPRIFPAFSSKLLQRRHLTNEKLPIQLKNITLNWNHI